MTKTSGPAPKTRTQFEQIPVEVVKRIADPDVATKEKAPEKSTPESVPARSLPEKRR